MTNSREVVVPLNACDETVFTINQASTNVVGVFVHPRCPPEVHLVGWKPDGVGNAILRVRTYGSDTINAWFTVCEEEVPFMSWINVKDYGALGNNSANDTTAVQNAINAIPTGTPKGGVLYFPPGLYRCTNLDLSAAPQGLKFLGEGGGRGGSGYPSSALIHTGTSGSFIKAQGRSGFTFSNLVIERAGTMTVADALIDFYNASGEATYMTMENIYFKGGTSPGMGVNWARTTNSVIRDCHFQGFHTAVQFQPDAGSYNNGCRIEGSTFHTSSSTHIRGLGAGVNINNCVFEPRTTNDAGAIFCTTNQVNNQGFTISNCWMGDTTVPGQYWFTLYGKGFNVIGNYMGNHGINLLNGCSGLIIRGNYIYTDNVAGINFGTGITQYDCSGNTYQGTNPIVGSATYTSYTP